MITCVLHMVQFSAEIFMSSLRPFNLQGKKYFHKKKQNIFLFGERHLCAVCETVFRTAALFALTIGMSMENVTGDGKQWEEDPHVRTGN